MQHRDIVNAGKFFASHLEQVLVYFDRYDGGKSFQGFVRMMVTQSKKGLNSSEREAVREAFTADGPTLIRLTPSIA